MFADRLMGVSFLYRFLYLGLQFFISLIFANLLHPADFGVLSLMIVNASLISLVTGLGVEGVVMHNLTNKKWQISQAYSFLLIALLIQGVLFGVLETLSFFISDHTL